MKTKTRTVLCALGLMALTGLPCQAASVETPGFLKFDSWFPTLRDATWVGTDVSLLPYDPNYPNTPDMTSYAAGMNSRGVFPDDTHSEYGAHLTGWIKPTVGGNYNFYLASDDASQLWISTDSTEANLQLVAEETGCCKGFLEVGNPQTTAVPLTLAAGQKYAVKIIMKEGSGGDYVQVAMQEASGTIPAASLQPLSSTMLSSMADPTGASLAITQPPASISTPENAPTVSFSIATAAVTPYGKYTSTAAFTNSPGVPLQLGTKSQLDTFFQWFTNGVEVPGAHATNFSIAWPKKAQNGMKVKCYAAVPGIPLYSSEATLTVTTDSTPPTLVSAKPDSTFVTVVLKFSEPMSDTALVASHYTLDQGVTVTKVDRVDLMTVKLNTTKMGDGKLYTLTVNGVQDTATPPNTIAANTQIQFKTLVFVPGFTLHKKYTGFADGTRDNPDNLFNDPRFINDTPSRKDLMTRFEYPANAIGRDESLDPSGAANRQYFDILEGHFVPPTNGNYVFYFAFADRCYLYLSTDESAANKHQILNVGGWSDPRSWLTSHDYNTDQGRSDRASTTQWPDGNTITLQGGKRYYLMVMHHDASWAGGDWFGATYKDELAADPPNGSAPTLAGSAIGVYLDPTIGSVSFSLQPTNKTVMAGSTASFSALASGFSDYTTNLYYQWQSAPKGSSTFAAIAGATAATYTTPFLVASNDGTQFRVIATVPPITATSLVATLTVNVDNVAPTVVKTVTDMTWTNVVVTYSEPVTDTALATSRYQIDQGITVSAVTRVDSLTVRLTTSKLTENKTYILTINGVQDTATPPNTIAANTQVEIRSMVFLTGAALHKKYNNIDNGVGSSPSGLFSDARYPSNPDRVDMELRWEYPADGAGRNAAADPVRNYFDTIEGLFIPDTTGDYVFYISGADRFWLYLSTDETPANKYLIAAQPNGWTEARGWMTGQGGTDMTVQRSDTFATTEWPGGNTINLQAGKRYYMLSVHHDPSWAGGDMFGATFKIVGEADPKDGDAPRLAGHFIGYYFDPSGASVTFTKQPQNTSVAQGRLATFSAAATGTSVYGTTVFYQWQSAPSGSSTWTDIAGATSQDYITPMVGSADNGKQFRVMASVPPYSQASSAATLTVTADTTPPGVTVGAMLDEVAGVVDVGVAFDEPVDEVSATLLSNYSVSPGTITGFSWQTNRFTANSQNPLVVTRKQTALLKVTGLTTGGTLTVKNVKDIYNNAITSVAVPFTVDTKMKWGVVGANEFGSWNAVVPVGVNAFDIYSDGYGAWGTYDESTFVYEQITGDFDKKMRVAYQDGSSQWARAGLIAKEATGFGVDRTTQATTAIRYQKCLVYPVGAVLQGPGTPGSAIWSLNRRLNTGGATDAGNITGLNAVPAYPNAWCRIQRVGQTFTMYRSDDGVNWVTLGSTTWGVDDSNKTPMPATLYVGPDFAPEVGNITLTEDRGTFLAQVRDYGDYVATFDPQLKIVRNSNGKVTITWNAGTLVSSPTVNGTYNPVSGATSPLEITPTATTFYRVRQ